MCNVRVCVNDYDRIGCLTSSPVVEELHHSSTDSHIKEPEAFLALKGVVPSGVCGQVCVWMKSSHTEPGIFKTKAFPSFISQLEGNWLPARSFVTCVQCVWHMAADLVTLVTYNKGFYYLLLQ